MNLHRFFVMLCAVAVASLAGARGNDLTQEYAQARKIALKDPRVRAAFNKANEVLEKRIIEIDPTLKPFIEKQQAAGKADGSKRSLAKKTHVVAQGETLSSIARRYRVSMSSLLLANHVSKTTTLQVGQKLVIPSN